LGQGLAVGRKQYLSGRYRTRRSIRTFTPTPKVLIYLVLLLHKPWTNVFEFVRIWPLTCDFLDVDPLPQLGFLSIAKLGKKVRRSPAFYIAMVAQELPLDSTPIAQSQGSLHVDVTGMY
jgi:hypothetical protein